MRPDAPAERTETAVSADAPGCSGGARCDGGARGCARTLRQSARRSRVRRARSASGVSCQRFESPVSVSSGSESGPTPFSFTTFLNNCRNLAWPRVAADGIGRATASVGAVGGHALGARQRARDGRRGRGDAFATPRRGRRPPSLSRCLPFAEGRVRPVSTARRPRPGCLGLGAARPPGRGPASSAGARPRTCRGISVAGFVAVTRWQCVASGPGGGKSTAKRWQLRALLGPLSLASRGGRVSLCLAQSPGPLRRGRLCSLFSRGPSAMWGQGLFA